MASLMFSLPRNEKEKLDTPPLTRAPGSVLCVQKATKQHVHLITKCQPFESWKTAGVNSLKLHIIYCLGKKKGKKSVLFTHYVQN